MKPLKMPSVKTQFFALSGGLDQVTPPIELLNGALRVCSNVEIGINGGYARLGGYERYNGKAKPSAAKYSILTCSITGGVSVGDVLTDNAGTSFGTVIALPTGQAVLTLITGTFSTGNIKVGATVVGVCTGAQMEGAADTPVLNARYLNLAADVYRALISAVPGSGGILGVWIYSGKVYAFRNNAGATAAVMHAASSSGWVAVTLFNEVSFTVGSGAATIIDGGTLTQGGVTATIKRVVVQSGSLSGGTAAGRLIIDNILGGNFAAGAATVGAGTLTLSAIQTPISFLPNGRFEFDNFNFGSGLRMYGCDGVNRGFEFDGTTLVPISTGMTLDKPSHVKAHKNHLFFSFLHSAQHSGIGTPYAWTPVTGAAELSCGDTINAFLEMPGNQTSGAIAIYTQNRTLVLYGNSSADWNLIPYSEEAGAFPYTAQYITNGFCLDRQGIQSLATTQNYGNFRNAVISSKITPYLKPLITTATASCIVRDKNQYRVFFSGGGGVYVTLENGKLKGITTVALTNPVLCICSAEGADGNEQIYFGSSNGYVYQMDIGTSFDGAAIDWQALLSFNHIGTPRLLKQFRKGLTEVTGDGYCEFSFAHSLGYGSTEYDASSNSTINTALSGAAWDAFTWDQFFWDGSNLLPKEEDLTGTAENISLLFSGSSDEFLPFTLNSQIIHYTERRLLR